MERCPSRIFSVLCERPARHLRIQPGVHGPDCLSGDAYVETATESMGSVETLAPVRDELLVLLLLSLVFLGLLCLVLGGSRTRARKAVLIVDPSLPGDSGAVL